MNVTDFLERIRFKPYSTAVNSWDSWNNSGSVLMQLWTEPGQRVRDHPIVGAYLRVCCWNEQHRLQHGQNQKIGYNGRAKAIRAVEAGAKGYAAMSDAPVAKRGPGAWAKYADLTKVYPILAIERPAASADIFAVLGPPVPLESIE